MRRPTTLPWSCYVVQIRSTSSSRVCVFSRQTLIHSEWKQIYCSNAISFVQDVSNKFCKFYTLETITLSEKGCEKQECGCMKNTNNLELQFYSIFFNLLSSFSGTTNKDVIGIHGIPYIFFSLVTPPQHQYRKIYGEYRFKEFSSILI